MRAVSLRGPVAAAAVAVLAAVGASPAGAADRASARPVPAGRASARRAARCRAAGRSDCELTGYQASGSRFRYAQAEITVPDVYASPALPAIYVALRGRYAQAQAGVFYDAVRGTWEAYTDIARAGYPIARYTYPVRPALDGLAVFVGLYFDRARDVIDTELRLPDGDVFRGLMLPHRPVFTQALAVADWSHSVPRPQAEPPGKSMLLTGFRDGEFGTLAGRHGTFAGPWHLSRLSITASHPLSSAASRGLAVDRDRDGDGPRPHGAGRGAGRETVRTRGVRPGVPRPAARSGRGAAGVHRLVAAPTRLRAGGPPATAGGSRGEAVGSRGKAGGGHSGAGASHGGAGAAHGEAAGGHGEGAGPSRRRAPDSAFSVWLYRG